MVERAVRSNDEGVVVSPVAVNDCWVRCASCLGVAMGFGVLIFRRV